jgi:hypothetical protein
MFNFDDAVERNKTFPESFFLPDLTELSEGCYVKICHNHERFWVIIQTIENNNITGLIYETFFNEQPFNINDVVHFEPRHIFQIANPKD